MILDVFIMIILFIIPFFVLELKRRKSKSAIKGIKVFDWIITGVIAIFFASIYYMFKNLHTPWKAFNPLHLFGLFMSFAMPFALAYLCKGTGAAKTAAIIMSAIIFLSPVTRPFFLPLVRDMNSVASWDMAIPLNLCNISAIVYIIGILTDNQTIKNYMITFGLFGGLINNVQAHNTDRGTFWFYLTWESYFVHTLIIVIPIFMLLTNQIKPDLKPALRNILWIFPLYIISGFVLNPLWNTNFSFTAPIAFTKNLLPGMDKPLTIFGNPVDPLYMSVLLVAVFAFGAILFLLSKLIYKHLRPRFTTRYYSKVKAD